MENRFKKTAEGIYFLNESKKQRILKIKQPELFQQYLDLAIEDYLNIHLSRFNPKLERKHPDAIPYTFEQEEDYFLLKGAQSDTPIALIYDFVKLEQYLNQEGWHQAEILLKTQF